MTGHPAEQSRSEEPRTGQEATSPWAPAIGRVRPTSSETTPQTGPGTPPAAPTPTTPGPAGGVWAAQRPPAQAAHPPAVQRPTAQAAAATPRAPATGSAQVARPAAGPAPGQAGAAGTAATHPTRDGTAVARATFRVPSPTTPPAAPATGQPAPASGQPATGRSAPAGGQPASAPTSGQPASAAGQPASAWTGVPAFPGVPRPAPSAAPPAQQAGPQAVARASVPGAGRASVPGALSTPTARATQAAPGAVAASAPAATQTGLAGGAASARAAVQAAAVAAPAAAIGAAAPPGGTDNAGPATTASPPTDHSRDGRRHRGARPRLTRLRIGSHVISRSGLRQLVTTGHPVGLVVGTDRFQQPVPVRFFRPEPTRIGLVGGVGTGQLLAFRALALGARVVVVTTEPHVWQQFVQRAGGGGDRISILTGEAPLQLAGSTQQPALIVYDLGTVGSANQPSLGRWQTQLTVLRRLDRAGVPVLQECHLVMLQRLAVPEMNLAANALRLSGQHSRLLQVMSDDMLALLGGGTDRYVWLAPTAFEHSCIASSRR